MLEIDAGDPAVGMKAGPILDAELVALSGYDHVVVPVVTHLASFACQPSCDRAGASKRTALRFLAPERASHPSDFHLDGTHGDAERVRHMVLNFSGVLAGALDRHRPRLRREGERDLAFKIEMLLAADFDLAFNDMGCRGDRRVRVASDADHRLIEIVFRGDRFVECEDCGERVVIDFRLARRGPRGVVRLGDNDEQRLARKMHRSFGKQRFRHRHRRHVVCAGKIFRSDDRDHRRCRPHSRKIHPLDSAMRDLGKAERQMKRSSRRRYVVDIGCAAGDVQQGGVVVDRGADQSHVRTSST